MKIYIAGKITGDAYAKEKFERAEMTLKKFNHTVLNPMKNVGFEYRQYIDMGLCELSKCDAIYMLRDWKESKGATLEHHYAEVTGMKIMYQEKGYKDI